MVTDAAADKIFDKANFDFFFLTCNLSLVLLQNQRAQIIITVVLCTSNIYDKEKA